MTEENDFDDIPAHFFNTPSTGDVNPIINGKSDILKDVDFLNAPAEMNIIITCRDRGYTKAIYPALTNHGWQGYWINAASALRMDERACITLDPVNRDSIDRAVEAGMKLLVGGNYSITLDLIGLAGLTKVDLIEWMSVVTYQSVSGAGAKQVRGLIAQSIYISQRLSADELMTSGSVLPLVNKVSKSINSTGMPMENFGVPLIGSIIPWIDSDLGDGSSREEWKDEAGTNKVLDLVPDAVPVNGLCIQVGMIRCHSATTTLKPKREVSEAELAELVTHSHPWVNYVRDNKQESTSQLTPVVISGSLRIGVGHYRKMPLNNEPIYLVLTVGGQLLWGVTEPLHRMLNILLGRV